MERATCLNYFGVSSPHIMSILDRDTLGAFCRHTHVELAPTGHGSLDGLTFALKDNFDVAGHRTGFGSPDWLRTHEPAARHAPVLTRLLAAGATMVGKAHTEEMTFSLTGENAHYGTPINPAAPDRVPGGSSSGSASAVAGNLVDFAIGSDTGGSVRAPASFCDIYGIRPTHGRISLDGVCPLAPSFDTCGWFTRDADMLRRIGQVLFDTPNPAATPGVLLYAADAFAQTMPGVDDALLPAVQRMSMLLGSVRPVTVSAEGLPAWYEVFRVLQFAEIWQTHGPWVREVQPTFGPQIAPRFEAASKVTIDQVEQMTRERARIQAHLDALLTDNAVLVLPTVPGAAPLRGLPLAETVTIRERSLALLCIAGLGGLPQVSLPMGMIDGCPVGLSLIASRGNDVMLLDLACRIAGTTTPHGPIAVAS